MAGLFSRFKKASPDRAQSTDQAAPQPNRQRRIQGIRARLGMAMAVALMPFILLGLAQARSEYQRQTLDLKTHLQLAAARSATDAGATLRRIDTMLMILAPETTDTYCSTRLKILSDRTDDIEALYRIDADGRPLCASDDKINLRLSTIIGSAWFEDMRQQTQDHTVRLLDTSEGSNAVQAYRVSGANGEFEGLMLAVFPVSGLKNTTTNQGLPPGSQAALYGPGDHALSVPRTAAFSGTLVALKAWLSLPAQTRPLLDAVGPDGIRRYYASAPVGTTGVSAVMTAPTASPWFWALSNPIRFLLMPLAACLTAFAAVMFASERVIIRWLDYLDRIAAIYARGRFTVRPVQADNAPLEIRHLARTMDELGENITRRDAALTEALNEKDALLREIHHRVKNNLQIISSLLSMQQRAVTDPAARAALGDTRQRISALALIYRTLYQGDDVRHADSQVFLNELVGHLVAVESLRGPLVSSSVKADSVQIDPEKLAPMALWLVEAISNAQKHAFANRGGELSVRFTVNGANSVLEVEDDGPGINTASPGVGLTLMTAFAKQLRGTAEVVPGAHGGSIARLTFLTPSLTPSSPS